jgi:SAM-dependent methyltransferase
MTLQQIETSIYDFPKYYDLVYGSDWKAEFNFLEGLFARRVPFKVRRIFEPACGTGRLLFRFAQSGFRVGGNDLNAGAIDFCNRRLARHGIKDRAEVGDMTRFELASPVHAAFNTINSFRHLGSESQARSHLRCMANAIKPGGIYALGFHLSPAVGFETLDTESWSATRGHLTINTRIWLLERNYGDRYEIFCMQYDIYTPTRQFQIINRVKFRTYTCAQIKRLVKSSDQFRLIECFDFRYDLDEPVELENSLQDVVLVLQRV